MTNPRILIFFEAQSKIERLQCHSRLCSQALTSVLASMTETVDWTYAICELLDKQGVDLRKEMDERLLEMEEQYRRERAEIDRRFDEQRRVRAALALPLPLFVKTL